MGLQQSVPPSSQEIREKLDDTMDLLAARQRFVEKRARSAERDAAEHARCGRDDLAANARARAACYSGQSANIDAALLRLVDARALHSPPAARDDAAWAN